MSIYKRNKRRGTCCLLSHSLVLWTSFKTVAINKARNKHFQLWTTHENIFRLDIFMRSFIFIYFHVETLRHRNDRDVFFVCITLYIYYIFALNESWVDAILKCEVDGDEQSTHDSHTQYCWNLQHVQKLHESIHFTW